MKLTVILITMIFTVSWMAVVSSLDEDTTIIYVEDIPGYDYEIQDAINAANPYDTIYVMGGTYKGAMINKPLTLIGTGPNTIILAGPLGMMGFIMWPLYVGGISPDGTTITQFNFQNCYFSIYVRDVNDITITHCDFYPDKYGIYGINTNGINAHHNTFKDSFNAIYSYLGTNWNIKQNNIEGCKVLGHAVNSIYLIDNSGTQVKQNTIKYRGSATGIYDDEMYFGIFLSANIVSENNQIMNNNIEIYVPDAKYSAGIGFYDFSAKYGGPIILKNNIIMNNDVSKSYEGVRIDPILLYEVNIIMNN